MFNFSLLLVVLCVQVVLSKTSSQFSLEVAPQSESCFFEELPEKVSVEATVLTYRGGKLDVGLRIEGPNPTSGTNAGPVIYEKLLFSNTDDRTGAPLPVVVKKGYKFTTDTPGQYSFCLNNKMARWTSKVCTLDISVDSDLGVGGGGGGGGSGSVVRAAAPGAPVPEGLATEVDASAAQSTATMRVSQRHLADSLAEVYSAITYHRTRTNRHHSTLLSTESRTGWWTVAESLVLCVVAALQLLLVTRWFAGPSTLLPQMGSAKKASPLRGFSSPAPLASARGGLV
jgi:hypothetical protein